MQVTPSSQLLAALSAFTEARKSGDANGTKPPGQDPSKDETTSSSSTIGAGDSTLPAPLTEALPPSSTRFDAEGQPPTDDQDSRNSRFLREAPLSTAPRFVRPGQIVDISV